LRRLRGGVPAKDVSCALPISWSAALNTPKFKTINDFEMINNNPPFFGWEKSWKGVWGYM
jgi:hypothetical protein